MGVDVSSDFISFNRNLRYWDLATGVAQPVEGAGHKNQVQKMSCIGDTICDMFHG